MTNTVFIGLEGHDGTGKSTLQKNVAALLNAAIYDVRKEGKSFKQQRDELYMKTPLGFLDMIAEVYRNESQFLRDHFCADDIVILDRTWVSHATEENLLWREQGIERYFEMFPVGNSPKQNVFNGNGDCIYPPFFYPDGVIQPDIIIEVILEESTRVQRISKRANLNPRELRLAEDLDYRLAIEIERQKFGCKPLRIRERDPKESALRALQYILASEKVNPRKIDFSHLSQM